METDLADAPAGIDLLFIGPAIVTEHRVGHRKPDDLLQSLDVAEGDRARSPRAEIGNEQAVTPGLGRQSRLAVRAWAPVRRDPAVKARRLPVECTAFHLAGRNVALDPFSSTSCGISFLRIAKSATATSHRAPLRVNRARG